MRYGTLWKKVLNKLDIPWISRLWEKVTKCFKYNIHMQYDLREIKFTGFQRDQSLSAFL